MEHFLDIAYTDGRDLDRFRQFDLYIPIRNPSSPLLVFVHGGAWRSEDKADHADLARRLAESTHFPVAVLNYSLTPRNPPGDDHFRHPGHADDILRAFIFLRSWHGPPSIGPVYDPGCLYLIGHSCSAHMLSSIFLDSSSVTPSLVPPLPLARAIKGIIMSEGIYDLDLLLASFPEYRQLFIAPAFGSHQSYALFSPTNFPLVHDHLRWLLIHSKADALVDILQSQAMCKHLLDLHAPHADKQIHCNFHELDADHNAILHTDKYVRILTDFVLHRA